MNERKRGTHGCYVHTDLRGDGRSWRRVKCSRHHAPRIAPPPYVEIGPPPLLLTAECPKCGAIVERTRSGNTVTETWAIR